MYKDKEALLRVVFLTDNISLWYSGSKAQTSYLTSPDTQYEFVDMNMVP